MYELNSKSPRMIFFLRFVFRNKRSVVKSLQETPSSGCLVNYPPFWPRFASFLALFCAVLPTFYPPPLLIIYTPHCFVLTRQTNYLFCGKTYVHLLLSTEVGKTSKCCHLPQSMNSLTITAKIGGAAPGG